MKHLSCHFFVGKNISDFKKFDSCKNFYTRIYEFKFHLRYPFDWKNPLGYLVVVTHQYVVAGYCSKFLFCAASSAIGCCAFLISIIRKQVKNDLKLINANAASDRNHSLTLKLVADFVGIHSFLKKLSVCFERRFHF